MQEIEVDITAIVEVWQVGAHFKALVKEVLVAPSILRCLFFTSQARPGEQCDGKLAKTGLKITVNNYSIFYDVSSGSLNGNWELTRY